MRPFLRAGEPLRDLTDLFLPRELRLRVAAAFLAALLLLFAFLLRVAAAFLAALEREAFVLLLVEEDFLLAGDFLLPELRLRVAAAFLAALLLLEAFLFLVAAAFLAAALLLEAVERDAFLLAVVFFLPAFLFRVAAAFFAAALLFAAFLFLVAAAFFAAADLDAFVPFLAAIFFTFFGGLTRIRFDSAMEGAMEVPHITGLSSNIFICVQTEYNVFTAFSDNHKRLKPMPNDMGQAKPKSPTQTLTLRLSEVLLESLRERAETENRTLSNLIRTYLEITVPLSTNEVKEKIQAKGRLRRKKNGR